MGTRRFVGAGGGVFDIDVPLSEDYQYQIDRGFLRLADGEKPVDEPASADVQADVVDPEDVDELARDDVGPVRPERAMPKARWVEYAQLVSDLTREEAEALNKVELIARFGGR